MGYHILHEGRVLELVKPERGIRQGDPISPYLFLLIGEGLTGMIRREVNRGNLHGISVARGAPSVTHLMFADDTFIFLRANEADSRTLKGVLKGFETSTGQQVNFDKSNICFSRNTTSWSRNQACTIMQIKEGDTTGRYLGLPSLVGRRKT